MRATELKRIFIMIWSQIHSAFSSFSINRLLIFIYQLLPLSPILNKGLGRKRVTQEEWIQQIKKFRIGFIWFFPKKTDIKRKTCIKSFRIANIRMETLEKHIFQRQEKSFFIKFSILNPRQLFFFIPRIYLTLVIILTF